MMVFPSYQWFCHFDDDAYLNVPQLDQLLQKYDPHQPHYIGSKWRYAANAPVSIVSIIILCIAFIYFDYITD